MAVHTAVCATHYEAGAVDETPIAGYAWEDQGHTVVQFALFGTGITASLVNSTTGERFDLPAADGSTAMAVTGLTVAPGGGPGNFSFQSSTT